MQSQGSNGNIWYQKSYVVKVPSWYDGQKYVIVNVAENYMQLWDWGKHIENSAYIAITKCAPPTATNTPIPPTATDTPIPPTATNTPFQFTPTYTTTAEFIIFVTPVVNIDFQYKSGGTEQNIIKPFFRVYNNTDIPLDLSNFNIKYWYKYEGLPQNEIITIYASTINGNNTIDISAFTNGTIVEYIRGDQDRYLYLTFNNAAGILEPGQFLEVQCGIQKADGSNYDQSNDWSYNGEFSDYSSWGRVVLEITNIGVYGVNPWERKSPLTIRVDCANTIFNEFIDSMGNIWERDRFYLPGGWGFASQGAAWWLRNNPEIGNTIDDELYWTVMTSNEGQPLSYRFDIPNGNYLITLKFVQPYWDQYIASIFNVNIEGIPILTNFNIADVAGFWNAYDLTFNITLTDGQLNIDFIPIQYRALVAAIEIQEILPSTPTPAITYSPTLTITLTYTITQINTETPTISPTLTPTITPTLTETVIITPLLTPNPTVLYIKDRGIDWLHTMQILNVPTTTHQFGAWPYQDEPGASGTPDPNLANVGTTALAILALLNEGMYNYYTTIPPYGPYAGWNYGLDYYDPAVTLGIDYILRNVQDNWYTTPVPEGPITDDITSPPTSRGITDNYDTACALVALSAYRRIGRTLGVWSPNSNPRHEAVERAMASGYYYLLNTQMIDANFSGGLSDLPNYRIHIYHDDHGYFETNCHHGGWGYPLTAWTDMSNTQFAVWALEVLDTETRDTTGAPDRDLNAQHLSVVSGPTGTGELIFFDERRNKAYLFIQRSNEMLNNQPEGLNYYPPTPVVSATPAGGLYGSCDQRTYYNNEHGYGSMTAAGLWSLYCIKRGWNSTPPGGRGGSDPVAWNEMLWFQDNNFAIDQNKPLGSRWHYYYLMSMTKAFLMNKVPQIPGLSNIGDWYAAVTDYLTNPVIYKTIMKPFYSFEPLTYWDSADSEELDVFSTICAILGIESKLPPPAGYGNKLQILLMSPAELLVFDEKNNKAGCENGINYMQIPLSVFSGCGSHPQTIEIDQPSGIYTIRIKATGNENLTLSVSTYFAGNQMSKYNKIISAETGKIYEYKISVGNVYWPMTLSCDFAREIVMPTGTETPTITMTPTPSPTMTETETPTISPTPLPGNLRIQYYSYNTNSDTDTIYVIMRIYNEGPIVVNLSNVSAKYWYTYEGLDSEVVEIDWAGKMPSGQNIKQYTIANIQAISQAGQDRVQTTSFEEGAGLLATGEYVEVHLRIHHSVWASYNRYNQTNDHSFGTQNSFIDWNKITAYINGVKVWGYEPGEYGTLSLSKGIPGIIKGEPISEKNTFNYPNPCKDKTIIRFSLDKSQEVSIAIYNINDNIIWQKELSTTDTHTGINYIIWDGTNEQRESVANGIYLLKVKTKDKVITKKIAVIR